MLALLAGASAGDGACAGASDGASVDASAGGECRRCLLMPRRLVLLPPQIAVMQLLFSALLPGFLFALLSLLLLLFLRCCCCCSFSLLFFQLFVATLAVYWLNFKIYISFTATCVFYDSSISSSSSDTAARWIRQIRPWKRYANPHREICCTCHLNSLCRFVIVFRCKC